MWEVNKRFKDARCNVRVDGDPNRIAHMPRRLKMKADALRKKARAAGSDAAAGGAGLMWLCCLFGAQSELWCTARYALDISLASPSLVIQVEG